MDTLTNYINSIFQDFYSFLRTEVDLVEDYISLVLDEYNSIFITFQIKPGYYTFKALSEVHFNILHFEYPGSSKVIDIETDDITIKIKLVARPGVIAIRFDEKSFFSTILGFNLHWDYEHCNEYTSQKVLDLDTINKIHFKYDVIDGSIMIDLRQPMLYSFVLDKPAGFKVFFEHETIQYK